MSHLRDVIWYFTFSVWLTSDSVSMTLSRFIRVGANGISESCSVVSDSLWPHGQHSSWNSPGQNTGVGSLSLLWGIFPTQGLSPGLLHCRWILYQLSHQGNPRILKWVAYSFFSGFSRPRNLTRVSGIAGRFFTSWASREAHAKGIISFFLMTK